MISEALVNLVNEKISSDNSSTGVKQLNKQIRKEAISAEEKAFVGVRLRWIDMSKDAVESIHDINDWDAVVAQFGGDVFRYADKLLEELMSFGLSETDLLLRLRRHQYFHKYEYLIRRMNASMKSIENEILGHIMSNNDPEDLLVLCSVYIDNNRYIRSLLDSLDLNDFDQCYRIYFQSGLGTEVERRVMEKLVNEWPTSVLLYSLYNLRGALGLKPMYFDSTPFDHRFQQDDLPGIDEIELGEYISNSVTDSISDSIKKYKLRILIIKALSHRLNRKSDYLLFLSCLNLDEDIRIIEEVSGNMHLVEWARIEMVDNRTEWYSILNNDVHDIWSVVWPTIELRGMQIIDQYLSVDNKDEKNGLFWILKYKMFANKFHVERDLDFYDSRLWDDSRFRSYYSSILHSGLYAEQSMVDLFGWPCVKKLKDHSNSSKFVFEGQSESPIHDVGYVVGTSAGLDESTRRDLLSQAFLKGGKSFVDYGWGSSASPRRLSAMAWHIARNIWRVRGRKGYEKAAEDWSLDLDYLKSVFYDNRMASEFAWPHFSLLHEGE